MKQDLKDFFISYRGQDLAWAEWIGWQLEEAHHSVILQAWDFRPGASFLNEMDKASKQARCTLAVLTPAYFTSAYTTVEWQAAYTKDPLGEQGLLLPVRVQLCDVEGLLGPRVYIDLVNLDETIARDRLLAGVARIVHKGLHRAKPSQAPAFPGSVQHLVAEPHTFPGSFPALWNVPSRRNPFFVGREHLLEDLHTRLTSHVTQFPSLQIISGLGGMGKTQTALEYAYRYRHLYQAILWVNAATSQTLAGSFLELATLLNLPEQQEHDQTLVVSAIKRWFLLHDSWLLIVDNADDLALAEAFLPTGGNGHVLLTTRADAAGTLADGLGIEQLPLPEAMLLLLRRAKVVASGVALDQLAPAHLTTAEAIAQEMDGLPLALDQAGAYIEETRCSLSSYLERYRNRQASLLRRRGGTGKDHPDPVATTWSLSFEQVEQRDAAAADLLRVCAFLAPDAIPEQLIVTGASHLGPHLQLIEADPSLLDEAIRILLGFSFVKRKPEEQTITVHRLVQTVMRTSMDASIQQRWLEQLIQAITQAFPDVTDYRNWAACQQDLPHAQIVLQLANQQYLALPEMGSLLNKTGYYLHDRAQYELAEPLYQRAFAIGEKVLGPDHPNTKTFRANYEVFSQQKNRKKRTSQRQ